ncbi:MAG: sialate O-acetylesterase [Flavisolibacter sp.]
MLFACGKYKALIILVFVLHSFHARAGIALPKIIGDNMVLQRNKPVVIWGSAGMREKITVNFEKQTKTSVADDSGNWRVVLDPMAASGKPAVMTIVGNHDTISLKNILVGEVWLCSGQSNMEYTMMKETRFANARKSKGIDSVELTKENYPDIRLFLVKRDLLKPGDVNRGWKEANGEALRAFSAAGYFFAKKLFEELHVPIGVISSAVPGSAIEPWMSGKPLNEGPAFKVDETQPGKFYTGWIKPLAPFTVQGFLWYQGETNCFLNETTSYSRKFLHLINSWRQLWNEKDAAFYFVQIAPFYYSKSKGKIALDEETLPRFWKAQEAALSLPHTGMAATTDLADDINDLHPTYKWKVGERLALIALARDYHKNIVYAGPAFKKITIKDNKLEVEFANTGKGLISNDRQPLNWFAIAGADEKFVPATAEIRNGRVVVWANEIRSPKYVRFGWNEAAQANLCNSEGLPALPFSTDEKDWAKEKVL